MGCDTLVALADSSQDGVTLFAKNSDRPPTECQRVVQIPRRIHPAGARVRCQYLELPQVGETAALLGSQPHWLWGFEHGVNEHRVAIGNETVFAREPLGPIGLLGMDLVRLGLERGRTATQALEVMTALLEEYGQGGSGQQHLEFAYHNAFVIADPTGAWLLETSDRHWVARAVRDVGNLSNGLALGADWHRGATDVTSFAVARGWWPADGGPVDFRVAYADETGVPPNLADTRRRRAGALLAEHRGRLTPATLRAVLRDHYDDGPARRPRPFDDPCFFSLCMHADPLDNTTAAMVAALPAERDRLACAWVCLGSPCTGVFVPCYLDGTVPARLGRGGAAADAESPWWQMRALLTLVERDPERWGPVVRARWDELERAFAAEAHDVEQRALGERRRGRGHLVPPMLTAMMERFVDAMLGRANALRDDLCFTPPRGVR